VPFHRNRRFERTVSMSERLWGVRLSSTAATVMFLTSVVSAYPRRKVMTKTGPIMSAIDSLSALMCANSFQIMSRRRFIALP
jgi:hypothetical protein